MHESSPVYVVNWSGLLSTAQVARMLEACRLQLTKHVSPAWRVRPRPLILVKDVGKVPKGGTLIWLFDDPDQMRAFGWLSRTHPSTDAALNCRLFARTAMRNAGWAGPHCLSAQLSALIIGLHVDPHATEWYQVSPHTDAPFEVTFPVEGTAYPVNTGGVVTYVSNFVLPTWFQTADYKGPVDHMQRLAYPGASHSGGYRMLLEKATRTLILERHHYPLWMWHVEKNTNQSRHLLRIGNLRRVKVVDL